MLILTFVEKQIFVGTDWYSGMQHKQFEQILVGLLGVGEANIGAFRARLRHLRKLNVPNVPKLGSGNVASYDRSDVLITFVALALQSLGSSPIVAAIIARLAAGHIDTIRTQDEGLFLVVTNVSDDVVHHDRIPTPGEGTIGVSWINTSASTKALACVVKGAAAAGAFVTQKNISAASVINLSACYEIIPDE